jgi:DNA-binding transcriptional ArsR family regulator
MASAEPRLARVAAAIADASGVRTLTRLLDDRLYTARELARRAGVTPATMSAHLKLLLDEGLARVRQQGRHRYFGLADCDVAQALEALLRVEDRASDELDADLRHARSCNGHLAGELGVRLRELLLARGWVQAPADRRYAVTPHGEQALAELMPSPPLPPERQLYN